MKDKNSKRPNFQDWLNREFEVHSPSEVFDQAKKMLESKAETTNLFIGIAGLSVIAHEYGDKKGANACADALKVLANAHCNIHQIWRE